VDAAFADVYFTMVGVAVSSPEQSEVMFGAIVVGLLVSALAAGTIFVVRAWLQSRGARVREIPPLFVIPRPITGVEPIIGSTVLPARGAVSSQTPPSLRPLRSSQRAAFGERVVFEDNRFAEDDEPPARGANSETVRFLRPGEEPVQILPGRLEVLSGEPKHREIRFVRSPGEPAELILGREAGRSPQTVALHSDTVSRRHARFAYANGRWAVTNLSRTNPVVVNDERMLGSIERPLADGDRVELGEVVLRFRSR
jgi:FHA domain-containing protein